MQENNNGEMVAMEIVDEDSDSPLEDECSRICMCEKCIPEKTPPSNKVQKLNYIRESGGGGWGGGGSGGRALQFTLHRIYM